MSVSEDQLIAYHAGEVSGEERARIESELDRDPERRAHYELLVSDLETWTDRLRRAGPIPNVRGNDLADGEVQPDSVDGYRLFERIGVGGQGVVYRALQMETQRDVALKLLRGGRAETERARRWFEREIELAASLNIDGVVTIFDAGVTRDGNRFVAMALIDGERLDRYLDRAKPDLPAVIGLFRELAAIVAAAHQRSVLHRDLKPANVMIDVDGQLRVLDFGLAGSLSAGESDDGRVGGTPAYLAPEVLSGDPSAARDVRVDVYAIGVMLAQAMARHAHAHPWRRDADAVARMATTPDPSARYSSCEALLADLEAIAARGVLAARAGEPAHRTGRMLRRYRRPIGVIMAVLVLLSAAVVAMVLVSSEQRRLRDLADERAVEAREAGERAEARFNEVRELANTFVHEFDPLIRQLPGSLPARRLVIERALEYLNALASEPDATPELRIDLARAYAAVAGMQTSVMTDTAGDFTAGGEYATRAIDIARGMPFDGTTAQVLVASEQVLAAIALGRGADRDAMTHHRAALDVAEAWRDLTPRDLEARRAAASALAEVARVHMRLGDLAAASEMQDAATAEFLAILDADPDSRRAQRDVAIQLFDSAQLLRLAGTGESRRPAIAKYQEFLVEAERLRDADEQSGFVPEYDVAVANDWIGRLLADDGRPDEALTPLGEAARVFGDLAERMPTNPRAVLTYASSTNRLGEAYLALGRLDEAQRAFDAFKAVAGAAGERWPNLVRAQRQVGVALYKQYELAKARAETMEPGARDAWRSRAAEAMAATIGHFRSLEARALVARGDEGVVDALEAEFDALRQGSPSETP